LGRSLLRSICLNRYDRCGVLPLTRGAMSQSAVHRLSQPVKYRSSGASLCLELWRIRHWIALHPKSSMLNLIKSKTLRWTLSLNLLIPPKARDYSIRSVIIHRTQYLKIFSPEGVKTTRARAPRSLGATQEILGRHDLREGHEPLDVGFIST
jgi:hypothetical protein